VKPQGDNRTLDDAPTPMFTKNTKPRFVLQRLQTSMAMHEKGDLRYTLDYLDVNVKFPRDASLKIGYKVSLVVAKSSLSVRAVRESGPDGVHVKCEYTTLHFTTAACDFLRYHMLPQSISKHLASSTSKI